MEEENKYNTMNSYEENSDEKEKNTITDDSKGKNLFSGKIAYLIIIAAFAFMIVGFILTVVVPEDIVFEKKISIDGVIFHVPSVSYRLNSSGEDDGAIYQEYMFRGNGRRSRHYIHIIRIYVYKEKSPNEVLSTYKSQKDKWELKYGVNYGKYTGTLVLKKEGSSSTKYLFVSKKRGKTVAIFDNGKREFSMLKDNFEESVTKVLN